MTDKKGKTIKQIAEELDVSKTAVRQKIENLGLRSGLRKIGNQFAIDEIQENLIKSAFLKEKTETKSQTKTETKSETVSTLVSVLQEQLVAKDKQIEQLQKLLDQEQKLHAATSQRLLFLEEKKENEEPGSARWWQFWK